jgi:hypothetical protein
LGSLGQAQPEPPRTNLMRKRAEEQRHGAK